MFPVLSGWKDLPGLWGGIPSYLQHNMGVVGWSGEELLVPVLGLPNFPQVCKTALKFECRIFVVAFS